MGGQRRTAVLVWTGAALVSVVLAFAMALVLRYALLPPALSGALGAASDQLALAEARAVSDDRPTLVLIDIDDDALQARQARFGSDGLMAAPRDELAALLDLVRGKDGARSDWTILDVDVSLPASTDAQENERQVTVFRSALLAWLADPGAGRLILMRADACGWPASTTTPQRVARWRTTPYDEVIDQSGGRIVWSCFGVIDDADGVSRRGSTWSCADTGEKTVAIGSPQVLIGFDGSPPQAAMDRACRGDISSTEALGLWPVASLALDGLNSSDAGLAHLAAGDLASISEMMSKDRGVVVIGQSHRRAGDRYRTALSHETSGFELVGWQARTALWRGPPTIPKLELLLLGATLSVLVTMGIYLLLRWVRMAWVARSRPRSASRFCALIAFGPAPLQAIATGASLAGMIAMSITLAGGSDRLSIAVGIVVTGFVMAMVDFWFALDRPQQDGPS